jgi:acetolactate synthase-1/2/3 large subunit
MLSLEDVFREIPASFRVAATNRKGPVVIDFPMDMQRRVLSDVEISSAPVPDPVSTTPVYLNPELVTEITAAAAAAMRPILLLGQGALNAGAYEKYVAIANAMKALVVTSFLGVGSYDTTDERCLGYLGHTGHLVANRAVYESDFLLVLGSRLDVRQTGTVVDKFVPNGNVAWVDSDRAELANARVQVKWKIESDIAEFCGRFLQEYKGRTVGTDGTWWESILALKREHVEDRPNEGSKYLQPRPVLEAVGRLIGDTATTVVTGVGCHQHWAARHLPYRPNRCQLLTSGGHGTMGYDLPSAIGAAMACPDRRILCVVGDGSLLMNIQELATLSERNLDAKLLVLNNRRLGIVSQFQLITWGSDPTTGGFKVPDFVTIARGFGLAADRLDKPADMGIKLKWLWDQKGPALLDVSIDPTADVVPMLLGGQTMGEMWMGRKA